MSIQTIIQNGHDFDLKEGHFEGHTKIEQFFHYKYNNKGMDFDSIGPVVKMYCEIYEYLNKGNLVSKGAKNYNVEQDNMTYTGETMNSGLHILKKSMQFSSGYSEKCKRIGVSGGFSARKNKKRFIENLDDFHIDVNSVDLNIFLGLTNSIGNFIPVPQGFNIGRNLPTSDYWDIALYNIHLWYKTKNDDYLIRFLYKQDKDVIEYTKFWLNNFKSWHDFIKENYLEPFVENNQEDFKPKPFWNGHFSRYEEYYNQNSKITRKKVIEPTNIEEINQFLETVNDMILARGELIIAALLKR